MKDWLIFLLIALHLLVSCKDKSPKPDSYHRENEILFNGKKVTVYCSAEHKKIPIDSQDFLFSLEKPTSIEGCVLDYSVIILSKVIPANPGFDLITKSRGVAFSYDDCDAPDYAYPLDSGNANILTITGIDTVAHRMTMTMNLRFITPHPGWPGRADTVHLIAPKLDMPFLVTE